MDPSTSHTPDHTPNSMTPTRTSVEVTVTDKAVVKTQGIVQSSPSPGEGNSPASQRKQSNAQLVALRGTYAYTVLQWN